MLSGLWPGPAGRLRRADADSRFASREPGDRCGHGDATALRPTSAVAARLAPDIGGFQSQGFTLTPVAGSRMQIAADRRRLQTRWR